MIAGKTNRGGGGQWKLIGGWREVPVEFEDTGSGRTKTQKALASLFTDV